MFTYGENISSFETIGKTFEANVWRWTLFETISLDEKFWHYIYCIFFVTNVLIHTNSCAPFSHIRAGSTNKAKKALYSGLYVELHCCEICKECHRNAFSHAFGRCVCFDLMNRLVFRFFLRCGRCFFHACLLYGLLSWLIHHIILHMHHEYGLRIKFPWPSSDANKKVLVFRKCTNCEICMREVSFRPRLNMEW